MTDRQGRIEEVATERRRRDESTLGIRVKLAIPEDVQARLKAEGRTVRWANDEGNRIADLTVRDDYDKVAGVEPVPIGTTKEGKPIMAHLLSKPTAFIAEDREKADKRRRDMEAGMLKGHVPGADGAQATPVQGQMGAQTYVARETKIGRGNQIIE